MKILLLHPHDDFPQLDPGNGWDLVVDLGKAPKVTYERWSRQSGCQALSLYQFAEEIQDLGRIRQLLQIGVGSLVDGSGIDWWDVLSLEILPQLRQLLLVHRLAKELDANCVLHSSRPHFLATALQQLLGATLTIRENRFQPTFRKLRHYREAFLQLDAAHLVQVLEDKFDCDHSIRHHFTRRRPSSGQPVILLPSAYTNVSRTALSYAELLPDHQFLLVLARGNGKPRLIPSNVRLTSLTPYFVSANRRETAFLLECWDSLRKKLVGSAAEFKSAKETGVFERFPDLVHWGVALRDAWNQVFESENITACLCADDSNPPSSVPLVMAKQRGLPALACHHGALDYQMAVKTNHADFYLAKSEMERDYLRRVCRLAQERIVIAAPAASKSSSPQIETHISAAPWLVFFTEPYESAGWRSDEVYRDLLPRLCFLARTTGLKLVIKLHPLESIKGYRKMLLRLIPEQEREIEVIAGPPTSRLWRNTRFALTVQSSTALECAALGIPVFLCAWLRDPWSGYVQQFARFGIGRVLESAERIAEIPKLLEHESEKFLLRQTEKGIVDSDKLAHLFSGTYFLSAASNA
jgi:hypothetical protein